MNVQIQFKQSRFSDSDVKKTVDDALRRELGQARLRRDHFAEQCRRFEALYEMNSDMFLQQFEAGDLGDDAEGGVHDSPSMDIEQVLQMIVAYLD